MSKRLKCDYPNSECIFMLELHSNTQLKLGLLHNNAVFAAITYRYSKLHKATTVVQS